MMTEPHQEQEIPKQIAASLRAGLGDRLVAVILFGSRARGEASASSDWDMLVIAEGLPKKAFERRALLKLSLPPRYRGAISVLAKTPEEFEAHLPSLYLDIALDGQVLYDRQNYAAEKLTALRRLIQQAGLYRERTPAGDIWRWREEPAAHWALQWER